MPDQIPERRRCARLSGTFVVAYHVLDDDERHDVSQTHNISSGGLIFTADRPFRRGSWLGLMIRMPTDPHHRLLMIGEVIESNKVVTDLIYDIRLRFLSIDDTDRQAIDHAVVSMQKTETRRARNIPAEWF